MLEENAVVEIFPADKTCGQGCPPCPLANRGGKLKTSRIDQNVQKSFSIFESLMIQRGISYRMYYSGPSNEESFDFFPKMKRPGLVQEIGAVNLSKVSSTTNVDQLVEKTLGEIEFCLNTFFTKRPKVFRMTMVPENLFVGDFEREIISKIAEEVFIRRLLAEGGEFVFEIRSNLVPLKKLRESIEVIEDYNSLYLESLITDFWTRGGRKGFPTKPLQYKKENQELSILFVEYSRNTIGDHKITVTNRVIAPSETKIDRDFQIAQAMELLDNDMHFAIASQGVMCHHKSVAINNPILWMSHKTFQRELPILQKKFKGYEVKILENILLSENISIFYNDKSGIKRSVSEWIVYFDEVRESADFERSF